MERASRGRGGRGPRAPLSVPTTGSSPSSPSRSVSSSAASSPASMGASPWSMRSDVSMSSTPSTPIISESGGGIAGSPIAAGAGGETADSMIATMRRLMKSTDPIDIQTLSGVCENLVTKHPRKASKYDAMYPIWRIHYDQVRHAEGQLRSAATEFLNIVRRHLLDRIQSQREGDATASSSSDDDEDDDNHNLSSLVDDAHGGDGNPHDRRKLKPATVRSLVEELSTSTSEGQQLSQSRSNFLEIIRIALTHLDKVYNSLQRFGNTDHGQLLIYRYWIYRGDCERYRERNEPYLKDVTKISDTFHHNAQWDLASLLLGTTEAESAAEASGEAAHHHALFSSMRSNFVSCRRCYTNARVILPHRGQAYNQLGVAFEGKHDPLQACSFYIKAFDALEKPFPKAKSNLAMLTAKARSQISRQENMSNDDDDGGGDSGTYYEKASSALLAVVGTVMTTTEEEVADHTPPVAAPPTLAELIYRALMSVEDHLRSRCLATEDHFGLIVAQFAIYLQRDYGHEELLIASAQLVTRIVMDEEAKQHAFRLRSTEASGSAVGCPDTHLLIEALGSLLSMMEWWAAEYVPKQGETEKDVGDDQTEFRRDSKSLPQMIEMDSAKEIVPGFPVVVPAALRGLYVTLLFAGDTQKAEKTMKKLERHDKNVRSLATADAADADFIPEDGEREGGFMFCNVLDPRRQASGVNRRSRPTEQLTFDESLNLRRRRLLLLWLRTKTISVTRRGQPDGSLGMFQFSEGDSDSLLLAPSPPTTGDTCVDTAAATATAAGGGGGGLNDGTTAVVGSVGSPPPARAPTHPHAQPQQHHVAVDDDDEDDDEVVYHFSTSLI